MAALLHAPTSPEGFRVFRFCLCGICVQGLGSVTRASPFLQPHVDGAAAAAESGLGAAPPPSAGQRLADLLLWCVPLVSALVFGAGLLTLAALEFLLRGDHQMTFLSGAAGA